MSSKSAARYGSDRLGEWGCDEHGLPWYRWDVTRCHPWDPGLSHPIGCGTVLVRADQWGMVRLTGGPAAARFTVPGDGDAHASALRLELHLGEQILPLMPAAAAAAWQPSVCLGMGYVTYGWALRVPDLLPPLGIEVELAAPPGKPYVLIEIRLKPGRGGETRCALAAAADVAEPMPATGEGASSLFAREGVAIRGLGEERGDVFLAGSRGWQTTATRLRLALCQELTLVPGEPLALRLLLGCTPTCSVHWVREQFEGLTAAAVRRSLAEGFRAVPPSGSELWMREDALWCRGIVQAHRAPDGPDGDMVLHLSADASSPRLAHTLAICPLLQETMPDIVATTLGAITRRQDPRGRIPETLAETAPATLHPADCRSDTAAWMLRAWGQWLRDPARATLLDRPLPRERSRAPLLADRLLRSLRWIEEEVGFGPHGLIRMLGGDSCGLLDRAGRAGIGESVLVTGLLCCALRDLADAFRTVGRREEAGRLAARANDLAVAVGDAFADGAFLRGYTDSGKPFGDPAGGPVFTDVQAWAVLGRCGTVSQRTRALDTVLAAAGDTVPYLTRPFPGTWPDALSSHAVRPGEGPNGGVCLLTSAWFLLALTAEQRHPEALRLYRSLCLRRRAAGEAGPAAPELASAPRVAGPAAGRRRGWPEPCPPAETLPALCAVAWEEGVLRAIGQPQP
ncbi:MAG: hypothetical protein JXR77_13555 [Lentisphaeria bacterium]|nr:hypothetical protein [Lentisphaeria bacterium]